MTSPPQKRDLIAWTILMLIGFCWGLTGPLSKIAVSTGHHPVGVTFWGAVISTAFFTTVLIATGRRPPFTPATILFFLGCGFLGTALPNSLSYEAYKHLPVGVNVMILSLVPMATLMIAAPLGVEVVDRRKAFGLSLGVVAVALITLPDASLPSPGQVAWIALPVIVSISYAAENVFIARLRPADMDTVTVMWGLSTGGLILTAPVAFSLGAVFDITAFGAAERAVIASYSLHIVAYFGFVWLITRAGPVFASQVGYIVTATGVLLGMALFGERHSLWVWAALALMMIGLTLVKPRERI